jgi:mRNA interferase MazF
MRRGDIVTVAAPGDFGKPRPAVIVQGDALNEHEPRSTIVALMTSTLRDAPLLRLTVEPRRETGLKKVSQVQVHRLVTVRTEKLDKPIGRLSDREMVELNRLLALVIGIA